jgi:tRNA pseudouridine55 synthase
LAPRLIEIKVLDVVSFEPPDLSLLVTCSAGTYIRTLADDLGKALGGAAHLLALRRTQAGPFRLEQAVGLAQLRAEFDEGPVDVDGAPAWARHVRPAAEALPGLPNVQLTGAEVEAVQNGHAIPALSGSQGSAKALDGQGNLIAILEATDDGQGWHPQKVFPV